MSSRTLSAIGLAGCLALVLSTGAVAQRGGNEEEVPRVCPELRDFAAFHACALQKMKSFKPPRTADGKPDFNGLWSPTRSAQDIEEIKPGQYGNFAASKSL